MTVNGETFAIQEGFCLFAIQTPEFTFSWRVPENHEKIAALGTSLETTNLHLVFDLFESRYSMIAPEVINDDHRSEPGDLEAAPER